MTGGSVAEFDDSLGDESPGLLAEALQALSNVLLLLSVVAAAVAGIWLAVLGEWVTVLVGLAAGTLGPLPIGLARLLSVPLGGGAVAFRELGRRAWSHVFGLLDAVYYHAILVAWCVLVMLYLSSRAGTAAFVPTMLLACAAAVAPIWAQSETQRRNGSSDKHLVATVTGAAFLVSVLVGVTFWQSSNAALLIFSGIMLVGLVLQVVVWSSAVISSLNRDTGSF